MTTHGATETPDAGEDVIALLLGQHMRIRDLFDEVRTTTGSARQDAFERLVWMLAVHETAEEQIVHPQAKRHAAGGAEIVAERLAEENQAKEALARLESLGTDHEDFLGMLEELRHAVLRHAHYEERYEFPNLRQYSAAGSLLTMATLVRAAEKLAPTHPHPGIESATANITLGPGVALFDRIKDGVRKLIAAAQDR
jgi:hemerythrin superfamily protein